MPRASCIIRATELTERSSLAVAGEELQAGSAASTGTPTTSGDELHFVSVLRFPGEVVSIDEANHRITLKGPNGNASTLEVRNEKDLEALKVGDRVAVRYFEGAQISKKKREGVPVPSLKDGILGAGEKHAFVASVAAVDAADQEITLKGSDGIIETIMVTNPEHLRHIKLGDRVAITRPQALALSIEKEPT